MRWTRVLLPLALIMQGILLSGCTLIGGGIGALVDKQAKRPVTDFDALRTGARLNVQLKTGRQVSGRYAGMIARPDEAYAEMYRSGHLRSSDDVPELGSEVTLQLTSGVRLSGAYTGIGREGRNTYVALVDHRNRDLKVHTAQISGIGSLQGRQYNTEQLETWVADGTIPIREMLALTTKTGTTEALGLEQIATVTRQKRGSAMLRGLIIGGVVDLAVLSVIAIGTANAVDDAFGDGEWPEY